MKIPVDVTFFHSTSKEVLSVLAGLRKTPGVYTFWSDSNEILYVGMSIDLGSRIFQSFHSRFSKYEGKVFLRYVKTNSKVDAALLEVAFISKLKPSLNGSLNYDDELTIHIDLPELSEGILVNNETRSEVRYVEREYSLSAQSMDEDLFS